MAAVYHSAAALHGFRPPLDKHPARYYGGYNIGANADGIFARLAQAMGQPALAADERYATHNARGQHQAEVLSGLLGLSAAQLDELRAQKVI
jgi:crotonobetainyl-CoA:carnitine CoA-transferase CaiB-like acyl-CoA transferase